MKQYLDTMFDVLSTGVVKGDRTGTGTISKFGGMMRFPLSDNQWHVPTTRKVAYMKIAEELEWMIKGLINVQWLNDKNNNIWNSWVGAAGTIGPMYGEQWRNWNAAGGLSDDVLSTMLDKAVDDVDPGAFEFPDGQKQLKESFLKQVREFTKPYEQGGRGGVDQLQGVVTELLLRPESRRICVNVWNASVSPDPTKTPAENVDMGNMALAACHSMWQVNTQPIPDITILANWIEKNYDMPETGNKEFFIADQLVDLGWATNAPLKPNATSFKNMNERVAITDLGIQFANGERANGAPAHYLSLLCFARSQDLPLGTAYNVGMYSLLAHLLASLTNMVPYEYIHVMGDYHIYLNQVDLVTEQLQRQPMKTPRVLIDPTLTNINDFEAKNLVVEYESHPALVFPKAAV